MKKYLQAAMLATVLSSGAGAALAADVISESRSVDARAVNVDLDGLISLKIKQGPVASLTLYGEPEALKKVTVRQSGDTASAPPTSRASTATACAWRSMAPAWAACAGSKECAGDG